MNNTSLTPFAFDDALVRVIQGDDGEPWFVAADVCSVLAIANPSDAVSRLDEDERMTLGSTEGHSGKRGGPQSLNIINESGLYSLILTSRKLEAKRFKKWVTSEVLPSIRKTGFYGKATARNDASIMMKAHQHILKLMAALNKTTHPAQRDVVYQLLVETQQAIGMQPTPLEDLVPPIPSQDPLITEFWQRVGRLESLGMAMNHSRDRHLVAINMNQFSAACDEAKMKPISAMEFKRALRECPRLLGIRTVNSAINDRWNRDNLKAPQRPATMKCYVFTAEGDASC